MKRLLSVLLALALGVSLLSGCIGGRPSPVPTTLTSPAPTAPDPAPQGTLNLIGMDPLTLDPAISGDASSHSYVSQIFSGLVRLDDKLQPVGDIATSWDVSPDGKTYTFHLRPDAKFQDGRQVKAGDFKFSMERAANPATRSHTALTYLGDIVGVREMLGGQAKEISGVKVTDDATLQITIDSPKIYFLSKMTYPTAFVVDRNNVSRGANWWMAPNGTGPFKMTQYTKQQRLVLTRNDNYYGRKARVNSVVFSILSGIPMDLYETGRVDVVGVSQPYLERASDPLGPFAGQLAQAPELSFTYIGFNSTKPPFDDPDIRRAFSLAVDKDKLVSVMFKGMVQRADGVLPPGIPGHNEDLPPNGFDVARAKQLIAQSKYGSIDKLPPIRLTTIGEGGLISNLVEAVVFQWKENLGVNITIRGIEQERYIFNLSEEVDNMYDFGWIADYPHPQNFLEVLFRTGADNNYGGYSNPAFDALLDQAGAAKDFEVSLGIYRQAEQKLMEDAGTLPLFFGKNYVLVKPYLRGYEPTPMGVVQLNGVSVEPH